MMHGLGISGHRKSMRQLVNSGLPSKMAIEMVCVCVRACVCVFDMML